MPKANTSSLIRRARPQDIPAILEFVAETYGDGAPFKSAARHKWQYLDCPYTLDAEVGPSIWLAIDHDKVVGTIAVQDGAIEMDGSSIPASWIVDVMVHPDQRGKGLSHLIHDAVMAERQILVTLTMAPATRRVAERAGCLNLGPTRLFIRPHRLSGQTVNRFLSHKSLHGGINRRRLLSAFTASRIGPWLASVVGRTVAKLAHLKAPTNALNGFEYREVDFFPEDIDWLWAQVSQKIGPAFQRTSKFLNWRFVDCPELVYRRFLLFRDGTLKGYLVTRLGNKAELPLGVISDVLADPDDTTSLDALLSLAEQKLAYESEYLEAAASHPAWAAALRRAGYIAITTKYPTVVCTDEVLRERLEAKSNDWHFTKADHDWDQIHPM